MKDTHEIWVPSLELEMATYSSVLAWKIPWTEEPGRLQSNGRKESDTTEELSTHTIVYIVLKTVYIVLGFII